MLTSLGTHLGRFQSNCGSWCWCQLGVFFFSSQRVHPVFHVFCCIKNTLSFEGIWWNMSLSDTTSCCLDLPHSYSDGNSQRCLQMTTGQLRAAAEKPLPSALPFPPFSILNFLVIRADEAKVPLMTSPSGRSMIILHFPKSTKCPE